MYIISLSLKDINQVYVYAVVMDNKVHGRYYSNTYVQVFAHLW